MSTVYRATETERSFATDWHGGQASMLYAVSSTGELATGTTRPSWSDGLSMTDDEWREDLRGRLIAELRDVMSASNASPRDRRIANAFVGHLNGATDD